MSREEYLALAGTTTTFNPLSQLVNSCLHLIVQDIERGLLLPGIKGCCSIISR